MCRSLYFLVTTLHITPKIHIPNLEMRRFQRVILSCLQHLLKVKTMGWIVNTKCSIPQTQKHKHTHAHARTQIHARTHTHTHTHITHTHTHTHTHKQYIHHTNLKVVVIHGQSLQRSREVLGQPLLKGKLLLAFLYKRSIS